MPHDRTGSLGFSSSTMKPTLTPSAVRRIWMRHQGLDRLEVFGPGLDSLQSVFDRLGSVQIDTINVIERAHHHILWSRQPSYRARDLEELQQGRRSIFEYWTHALSYLPTNAYPHSVALMRRHRTAPGSWFASVDPAEARALYRRIVREGPLSISDIKEDRLVEKDHPWASRKPSKRVLQYLFYCGDLTISRRAGMLKFYECSRRHFGWRRRPAASTEAQRLDHLIDRALRAQGLVDVDSIIHLNKSLRGPISRRLARRARAGELIEISCPVSAKISLWARPETLASREADFDEEAAHILSPFDPLVIQRDRFLRYFGLDYRFEAYVPEAKRRYGYFACPVLRGERVCALIDMKIDRVRGQLRIQRWTRIGKSSKADRRAIEERLGAFENFQLGRES